MQQDSQEKPKVYFIWIPGQCWVRINPLELKPGHYNLKIEEVKYYERTYTGI